MKEGAGGVEEAEEVAAQEFLTELEKGWGNAWVPHANPQEEDDENVCVSPLGLGTVPASQPCPLLKGPFDGRAGERGGRESPRHLHGLLLHRGRQQGQAPLSKVGNIASLGSR